MAFHEPSADLPCPVIRYDGLNAALEAHHASRLFTSAAHASWLRAVMEAADTQGVGVIVPKAVPTLFAAANVKPPKALVDEAVERAASEPLHYQQVGAVL